MRYRKKCRYDCIIRLDGGEFVEFTFRTWHYADTFQGLFSTFTFSFFTWNLLFALIVVAVTACNACSFRVSKPWVFVGALGTGFHVSCVGDVSSFERQSAFVSDVTWFLCCCCWLATIPCFESGQFFVFLWIGDPLKRLCCCDEPNVGPESKNRQLK